MNLNKKIELENCFANNALFRRISKDEIRELSNIKQYHSYNKGDIIYNEGSRMSGVYCVDSGIIKHYKTGNDGKEQIVHFSKNGNLFGYRSVLLNQTACTTAKAIEKSFIFFIPENSFLDLIKNNSDFALNIIKLSCEELGQANQNILDIAQKNVRERLAEILLFLEDNFGINEEGYLNISLTREELAGLVGTATESVIRLLSDFKKDGLIEINKRKIKLINTNAIKIISKNF